MKKFRLFVILLITLCLSNFAYSQFTGGYSTDYTFGDVGIGTSSPSSLFEVYRTSGSGTIASFTNTSDGANDNIAIKLSAGTDNPNYSALGTLGLCHYNSYATYLRGFTYLYSSGGGLAFRAVDASGIIKFFTGGTNETYERMRIDNNGKIGIGTGTPQNKLDIEGGSVIGVTYSGTYTAPSNGLLVEGNVGIGITSPDEKLHVSGNILSTENVLCNGLEVFDDYTGFSVGKVNNIQALNYGTSYIGFNAIRDPLTSTWEIKDDNSHNGGALIYGGISGNLYFGTIPSEASPATSSQTLTDAQIFSNVKLILYADGPMSYDGKIECEEVEVKNIQWSDFVFNDDYRLKSLNEVEGFIKENKHLPDVPSEKEVLENGTNLAKIDAILLQKIEELTLYTIEQQKMIEQLKAEVETLKNNQ